MWAAACFLPKHSNLRLYTLSLAQQLWYIIILQARPGVFSTSHVPLTPREHHTATKTFNKIFYRDDLVCIFRSCTLLLVVQHRTEDETS